MRIAKKNFLRTYCFSDITHIKFLAKYALYKQEYKLN